MGHGFWADQSLRVCGAGAGGSAPPTQDPVTVTLGGGAVPVLGAVLSGYAAVYQIAIQIPAAIADGDYPIVATVAGAQSPNIVMLSVQH